MPAPSRLFGGLFAVLALASVSACQKPTPLVTLVSGGTSVHTDATIYCFPGQSAAQHNCRTGSTTPTTLDVKPGAPVGIDVARELASAGWVVVLPGATSTADQSSGKLTTQYFSFTPQFTTGPIRLEVRMLDHGQTNRPAVGDWQFVLVPH